jgi:hypothetical protein
MITYSIGGGLGNLLFQYVFARLLAEENNLELGTSWKKEEVITFTEPKHGAIIKHQPVLLNEMKHTLYPYSSLEPRHYHLQGYWQNADWYLRARDKIRGWVKNTILPNQDCNHKDVIAHIRLGDYKHCGPKGQILDPKYYWDCLKREQKDAKRLIIATDDPNDDYLKEFTDKGAMLLEGTEATDFWALTEYDSVICGNSTFSWWGAFLSNATRIYLPECWMRDLKNIVNLTKIQNGIVMPAGFIDYGNGGSL